MAVLTTRSFSYLSRAAVRRSNEANESGGGSNTRMVVEYAVIAIAILLTVYIVVRRIHGLKPANQTYWQFFVQIKAKRGPHYIPQNPTFNRTPRTPNPDSELAMLPAAYLGHSTRRTQARDVDAGGRRIGGAEVDYDGALDDKDILPAYDMHGGPPTYLEPHIVADAPSSVELPSRPLANGVSTRESEDHVHRPPSFESGHEGDASAVRLSPSPSRSPALNPAPLAVSDATRSTANTQMARPTS